MPGNHAPLITIGITAYNAADTLARAIECAIAQNWPNKEIIIVDDCSTDRTQETIKKYQNPLIRSFNNSINSGVAASRNVILREMAGDYVIFFDDDDVSTPDRIEKQFRRIKEFKTSDFVLCHSARQQLYPNGTKRLEKTPGSNIVPDGKKMFEKILLGHPVDGGFGSMATCSLMMPKSVIQKLGFYDESFRRCEDTDYTLRFALQGGYFLGINEPLVTQTMNISSEKTLMDEKKYHSAIYKKYEPQLGRNKTDFALAWLNLRYEFLHNDYFSFLIMGLKLFLSHPVLTLKKLTWALPNIGFNFSIKKLHGESHG